METIALQDQTLADIAVRYCGTLEAIFDIAVLNGLSITAPLEPGQTIIIPEKDYGFKEVVNYFQNEQMQPTSGLTQEQAAIINNAGGIGLMGIEINFIVS